MREVDGSWCGAGAADQFAAGDVNDALMRFNPIPNSCAMVRRGAVLDAGGFDPRYRTRWTTTCGCDWRSGGPS